MRKLWWMFVLVLAGCASAPAPVMTDANYQQTGRTYAALHRCNQDGHISPELAAQGIAHMNQQVSVTSYQPARIEQEIAKYRNAGPIPAEVCRDLAMTVEQWNQQKATNATNQAYWAQQNQQYINSTRSVNTYCNRIGTQTLCNSY